MILRCTFRKHLSVLCCAICLVFFAAAQNPIVIENALPGNPPAEWDIPSQDAGASAIQGFATDISVNKGDTVHFKIQTDATDYTIDIYRLGYYNGDGARKVGTGIITATLPQTQPLPLEDVNTGLVDCGNWSESAHWPVPASAVSGVYIAKLASADGVSHIIFIVRDDTSHSDLFFQTSDATWQAYNAYGGNSLYVGAGNLPAGHAAKVSYNRPFVTRGGGGGGGAHEDWIFNAEYPMIRFLEKNGYNLTYTTNVDAVRRGSLILNHKVFLSVGHDEYWSAEQRNNIEAARNAGIHLAFFSGNEVYWKTRWENSTDGSNTAYRTLVCYKEGDMGESVCGYKCDPTPAWTGLWRTGGDYDAGRPENALSGQISWKGGNYTIKVPEDYKSFRFWRNTPLANEPGETDLAPGTLGFEWNWEQYDNTYPHGRILLSSSTYDNATHKLSLYRHASGALVFGAGTVQWAWGLDSVHDRGNDPPDVNMQQATVNLLADMNVQPATLQAGLAAASASTDVIAPQSAILFPADSADLTGGTEITVTGTASDTGGVVAGVEVSTDGGVTWKVATGTTSWSYTFLPQSTGSIVIKSRAFDDSGNMEAVSNSSSSQNVVVLTPLAEGPGGPVLIVSDASNPFSRYTTEIVKAEGLNEYTAEDISMVDAGMLSNYDVVILGKMNINAAQATMFSNWVNAGGTLIAFRPSTTLHSLFGITKDAGTIAQGYLLVDTSSSKPGKGIVGTTIQYHDTADLYTLNGATSLATLYSSATASTAYSAITSRDVGANGGKAIAFSYDLPKSIVYTRQGNPKWAGQERDGQTPVRANDMFFGMGGDPDWIDFDKVAIPQADEQQRLLTNIILQSNLHRKPLPRFWFLPSGHKAAIVMTGDDHGSTNGTFTRFNQYMTLGPNSPQDVADWKAIRGSSYIWLNTPLTSAQAETFQSAGFEIALHLNTSSGLNSNCQNYTPASYENDLSTQLSGFVNTWPGIKAPATNRTHCIVWSDWISQPVIESQHGIRLDANYYYWPESWMQNIPGMFTGSGMPMRFADTTGTIIDCYQLTTQMTDETNMNYGPFCDAILEKALGPEGYYGVFCANMHTDNPDQSGSDQIIASAINHQVPVVSARQMLTWLDGRNNSYFENIGWSDSVLSFHLVADTGARNLRSMVPLHYDTIEVTSIKLNGDSIPYTTEIIKGIEYAFFSATTGDYRITYGEPVTGTISGTVTLQGRPAAPNTQWVVSLQVDLYEEGNTTTPDYTYNVTTGNEGKFTIDKVPLGTYTMAVKNSHTLKRVLHNKEVAPDTNEIDFGTLLEGDANNDNIVDLLDFGGLLLSYNKTSGDPGFESGADFNQDGIVDLLDAGILLLHYNQTGENP